jgi:hypothetical protein
MSATHEFWRAWPFWDRSLELSPDACTRFAGGLWDHQIHEHSGNFSRHGGWEKHETAAGPAFPRHGGYYIATWAKVYEATRDAVFLKAIEAVVDHYEYMRHPDSGLIPCCTKSSVTAWPGQTLMLSTEMWDAAEIVPEPLASKLIETTLRNDEVFLGLDHDLSPEGSGFCGSADTATGRCPGQPQHDGIWKTASGPVSGAGMAAACYRRYTQTGDDRYRQLVTATAHRYVNAKLDPSATVRPGSIAVAIDLMLIANEITGEEKYLEQGRYLADYALNAFFDETSPLPKAGTEYDHYETMTGGDDLMLAMFGLWQARNRP